MANLDLIDRIALYVGGGLVVIGVVLIGFLEMVVGAGHPVTGDGQIVHEALINIQLRSSIIILGLLIWGLYAIYKVAVDVPESERAGSL